MKRGADRQISKDDDLDNEIEEAQTGLQMAKESDLARREIKGLPKRKNPLAQAGLPPVTSATVCHNRAAFSSSPLTPARHYQPAAAPKFGYFSAPAGQPQEPAEASRSSAPAIAESASNATKKFASFLGPSSTAGAKPAVPSSDSPKPDASGDTDEVALKYYTSLRGLNTSFLSAVSRAIDSDPFADVVDLLEQYKKHRISVQTEYDGKSSQSTTRSAPSAASKPVSSAAPLSFGKPATSTSAAMPVPPSSFAGFPAMSTTASSTSPAPGAGFTPSPAASAVGSSSFGFPSVPPASSDTKPSAASSSPFGAFTAAPSLSSSKPGFSFGTSTAASTTSGASPFGSSQSSSGTSLFGGPPKSSTLFGPDSKSSTAEGKDKDKPTSNAFGSAPFTLSIPPGTKLFGDTASSNSASSIFGAKSTEKDKEKEKDTSSPPSSVFGATTFGSPAKPSSSPFGGFGSAAATATPAQFVFGVAAGGAAEGTPSPKAGSVGFSFGSPSRGSSQTAAPAAPREGGSLGFSFSSAPPASSGATAASTPASTNLEVPSSTSRADTPATDGTQEDGLARTQSPALPGGEGDAEGEGEEDEETTYTVKAKVYKFTTDNEGAPSWAEMGIGMLRLKKHKVTNARRVILRSSTTGKIIINFRIYAGLQPKRNAKAVAFTGHITSPDKETQTVQYRLRVGTEATATEMAEAIEREVRLVQAEAS
ncbi:hypothetical protein EDB85DRAFT_2140397 [Lactarius pseudohatsudake]|nr:hypothetical protein EDB85DRAFT_2140397 [Lactarius pseudohatsudake]